MICRTSIEYVRKQVRCVVDSSRTISDVLTNAHSLQLYVFGVKHVCMDTRGQDSLRGEIEEINSQTYLGVIQNCHHFHNNISFF